MIDIDLTSGRFFFLLEFFMKSWAKENILLLDRLANRWALRTRLERAIVVGRFLRKFDPEQPRVPAGNSDGGQWTNSGISSEDRLGLDGFLNECVQFAARQPTIGKCVDKCLWLLTRLKINPGSDLNEFAFRKCIAACMSGNQ